GPERNNESLLTALKNQREAAWTCRRCSQPAPYFENRAGAIPSSDAHGVSSAHFLLRHPSFPQAHCFCEGCLQGVGDCPKEDRRGVQDPTLDAAQVGPFKSAFGAQAVLGKSRLASKLSYSQPDGFALQVGRLNLACAPLHRQISSWYVVAY